MLTRRALLSGALALLAAEPARRLWAMTGPGAQWIQPGRLWTLDVVQVQEGGIVTSCSKVIVADPHILFARAIRTACAAAHGRPPGLLAVRAIGPVESSGPHAGERQIMLWESSDAVWSLVPPESNARQLLPYLVPPVERP